MATPEHACRKKVKGAPPLERIETITFTVPTDELESDGTLDWNSTTVVGVHIDAGGARGFGYTYAPTAAATLIHDKLIDAIIGQSAFDVEANWQSMARAARNAGRPGIASRAISAVDIALWDLKAKLLGLPLVQLWGTVRESVPIYGSGGFTSYDASQLANQLGGWAAAGVSCVKMKVGRAPSEDPHRVALARKAIGDNVDLMVDANGGYDRKQALRLAERFAEESNVIWFEEPRPSDDLAGLRLLRDRGPAGMDIAAGEYGCTPAYFRCMLGAGAVDCLQADATRCGGFTGFFKVAALCEAFHIPLSAHCAPQLHAHLGCCVAPLRHIEFFHDHVRIGELCFEGALESFQGCLRPDTTKPGLGLNLRAMDDENIEVGRLARGL